MASPPVLAAGVRSGGPCPELLVSDLLCCAPPRARTRRIQGGDALSVFFYGTRCVRCAQRVGTAAVSPLWGPGDGFLKTCEVFLDAKGP